MTRKGIILAYIFKWPFLQQFRVVANSFFRYEPINKEYTPDTTLINWRALEFGYSLLLGYRLCIYLLTLRRQVMFAEFRPSTISYPTHIHRPRKQILHELPLP